MMAQQKILVSPLDWGLGHATRLIPVLKELESNNDLIIGINRTTEKLMKEHFPMAQFEEVPAYKIRNSKSGGFHTYVRVSLRIKKVKKLEEQWVSDFLKDNQVDLIISDSRFGFRNKSVKSIIISHQLNLKFPSFWRLFGKIAQGVNKKWLSAFDEVWIPDNENHELSGELSKETGLKIKFIGTQSRFKKKDFERKIPEPYILFIISGPEPQRSEMEHMILHQAPLIRQKVIIVGGKPEKNTKDFDCANAHWYAHMKTEELAAHIAYADMVISRSGYSSLMDYQTLGCKNLFLIPTPGQSEQIYLAKRMKEKGICDYAYQNKFILSEALLSIDAYKGFE